MATIKFYRSQSAPLNPQEGFIWFNSANNTIQLYKNNAWEVYTGKINDVTYTDGVLTITPHIGDPISINLGNVANIEGLATRLGNLETKVTTLEGTVGTHSQAIATVIGKLAGVQETVVKEIAKETTAREAADSAFDTRVGTAESDITNLKGLVGDTAVATQIESAINALDNNGVTGVGNYVDVTVTQVDGVVTSVTVADGDITTAIDTEKGRIDTLVGADTGKSVRQIAALELASQLIPADAKDAYDTLQEIAAWIQAHPGEAASMNEAIGKNTSAITTLTGKVETLEKIDHEAYVEADTEVLNSANAYTDELKKTVTTNTSNIATNAAAIETINGQITEINTVIEENELIVASALTDLDTRVNTLTTSTVKSVEGQNYVETTSTDGVVNVKAITGTVASGANALAIASDVKTYVETCVDSSWE